MLYSIKVKQRITGKVPSYMSPQSDVDAFLNAVKLLTSRGFEIYATRTINDTSFIYMKLRDE